ncbi:hypothetical protein ACSLPA_34395, partial [Escherichia coli]
AITLLTQGGRLTCKFRLSGALTNNQFGLGIYLYTDAPVPDGVSSPGEGLISGALPLMKALVRPTAFRIAVARRSGIMPLR